MPRPRHRWFAAVYDHVGQKQLVPHRRFAAGGARGRVLEIGAGTGSNLAFYDWDQVESLDAAEPDPFMLRRARAKLQALPEGAQARVRLYEEPAESLPFGDAEFDCVVVTLVLCTVSDPSRSLAEIRRVLKPTGELRLVEHVRAEGILRLSHAAIQPVYGWFAAGCHLDRPSEQIVREAGFEFHSLERFRFTPFLPGFQGAAH